MHLNQEFWVVDQKKPSIIPNVFLFFVKLLTLTLDLTKIQLWKWNLRMFWYFQSIFCCGPAGFFTSSLLANFYFEMVFMESATFPLLGGLPSAFALFVLIIWALLRVFSSLHDPVGDPPHQPAPHSHPVHHVRVLRGHAPGGEPPQRHRLQLRPRQDQRHGTCRTDPPPPPLAPRATVPAAWTAPLFLLLLQVKAGFGVNLIGVAVVMLAITTWGVPLFNLTEFPVWAMARNVTGSL